jgi:ABC-type dipeptide/oligopeptide/nickel transport system permease subunit
MTALTSWTLSVLGILLLVLFLNHLGLNVTADLGSMLRNTEHWLAQPLTTF